MRRQQFLAGDRIYLRPLEPADADANYGFWLNDPQVCRFNAHHRFPYTRADLLDYIEGLRGAHDRLVLAIVEREGDRHVGNISLQSIDPLERSAEFAIVIGEKSAWGKGFSKEAARLIIGHGFAELNLHRIYCGTSADNLPMQKLALAMGFSLEGRRREALYKSGGYRDILEYGLLRKEWIEPDGAEVTT